MEISYALRSKFLAKCERTIKDRLDDLNSSALLRVEFESGGYNDRVVATIMQNNHNEFGTDWEQKDPTRFPARIKAAATALYNCECFGRYEIIHKDGLLTIRKSDNGIFPVPRLTVSSVTV